MERLERNSVIPIAVPLTLGFATWQFLSSVSHVATALLVDWWEDSAESFTARFSIGGVDIQYGQLLASLITLLLTLAVAVPLLRYATHRRPAPSPP